MELTVEVAADLIRRLSEQIARLEAGLEEIRLAVVEKPAAKQWYTIEEAAKILGKSRLTIREHCRFGRIRARKRDAGRSAASEWAIEHAELVRVQNEGLLPLRKHVPDRP